MTHKRKNGEDALSSLITDYCKRHPEMLTQTLARMILKNHPELFGNLDQVRSRVRHRRGANGEGRGTYTELHREQKPIREWMQHFSLPEEREGVDPYIIPTGVKKTLLFGDVHLPYHEYEAVAVMLEYADKQNVDSVIINGDLLDFYKLSRFTKDPTRRSFTYELDMAAEFFEMLRGIFPTQEIYYKMGNHEDRYETYLKLKAPELFGDTHYSLEDRLNLASYKIRYIESSRLIKYGKLNIIHGHEFGGSFFNPVNPARGLFMRAKCNIIAGHNHQTSEHHENNLNGESMATWSIGCLCQLDPEYRPFAFTKWNWGFGILEKEQDGSFRVQNKRIIKGKVL